MKRRKFTPLGFKKAMAVFGLVSSIFAVVLVFLPWEKPWTSSPGIPEPISGWELATEQGWISPYIPLAGVVLVVVGAIGELVSRTSRAVDPFNLLMVVGGALILIGGIWGYFSVPPQANILPGTGLSAIMMVGGLLLILSGMALIGGFKPERIGLKTSEET